MTVSRAEQRAATRRALLDEGRRRFAAEGYHHVVLAEVARAAGVTKGAAYHHFDSKAGLFRAVVREVQQELGERVATEAERHEDLWEQLRAGCRAFLQAGTDPAVRQILLTDAPTVLGWDEWRAQDEEASARHLAEALTALTEAGIITGQPAQPLTRLLSGAMNEAALWIARGGDTQAAEVALDRLLAGLRTPA
ncbi:TetR/AcrR family transcriptional regulator [Streptomyces ficellus]|uniref:TetR/AcrR family transcriptional regulator n=1 Tax=Streptomyces ficellus TaxID=1977088 RepID=A0A6I6FLH2_9ACTN|nr:TetR/AcrR family transcriptional regulator [Streptomyces ficellus]QGV82367.1 TetR/AcrR family transcriptional regulator [Streptomyces ficellus]QGV82976.1 TetR/AcrR family transcriptional regulator [Streptomyces ficellus]